MICEVCGKESKNMTRFLGYAVCIKCMEKSEQKAEHEAKQVKREEG